MAEEESKRRLGRGLAALIGDMDQTQRPPKPASAVATTNGLPGEAKPAEVITPDRNVPIEFIRANPNNPRRFFNEHELSDLATSIKEHGLVQPILVRPIKGEDLAGAKYEIIAGERRWRASQKAGLHQVPVVVREVGDRQALELAIIENVQRSDLNPVEEALGYQQLIDEYDYSQSDLGDVIGKSRSHVANTLRLLKLPQQVREMVQDGSLSAGHARTLVTADDPITLARRIVDEGLSVRQAEAMAHGELETKSVSGLVPGTVAKEKDADIRALERDLGDVLGMKINLNYKPNGKGDLKIGFKSLEQLDYLCQKLRGDTL